jgi:hypothetical protein
MADRFSTSQCMPRSFSFSSAMVALPSIGHIPLVGKVGGDLDYLDSPLRLIPSFAVSTLVLVHCIGVTDALSDLKDTNFFYSQPLANSTVRTHHVCTHACRQIYLPHEKH